MNAETFRNHFDGFNADQRSLVCMCTCTVDYSGRAESHLPPGDRILIFKSDNTLLVHQPENSDPINYMKAGTTFELTEENDHVLIEAQHTGLKEYMDIQIHDIHHCIHDVLDDGRTLQLIGTEEDMSDMIKEQPSIIAETFTPLSREEHTKYGFIDVFGHDTDGNLIIVECKRYTAGLDAVQQLRRYVEKIEDVKGVEPRGVIASPDMTDNARGMLKEWGFRWERVEPPKRRERFDKEQERLEEYT